jgi:DNA-binding GntR family transcriptional regulator
MVAHVKASARDGGGRSEGLEATRSQSAYEAVRRMILAGEIGGGTVINERRVADRSGLSRTPVREAFGRLEGEGYLRRDGRVMLVNGVAVEEIMEILAVRRVLEVEAVRLSAGRISTATLNGIRKVIRGLPPAEQIAPEEHWRIDDLVHHSIAEASGNRLLARMIADLRQRTRIFGKSRIPSRFEPGKAEHLAILSALAEGAVRPPPWRCISTMPVRPYLHLSHRIAARDKSE